MPHTGPRTTLRPLSRQAAITFAAARPLACGVAMWALCLLAVASPAHATNVPTTDPTGRYQTADGRVVQVFRIDGALFAVVGRSSAVRLLPDGDRQHVSADGRLRLRLAPDTARTRDRLPPAPDL